MSIFHFLGYIRYSIISLILLIALTFAYSIGIAILPGLGKMLFDKVFMTFDPLLLSKYVLIQLYIISYLVVINILFSLYESNVNIQISNKIKTKHLRILFHSKMSFFKAHDIGFLVKRIIEDSDAISYGLAKFFNILCNIVMIVSFAIILYNIEYWLFILYVVLICSSFTWMLLWVIPIHYYNMQIGKGYSNLYKLYWEIFQGIKEIKVQNLNGIVSQKIVNGNKNVRSALLLNTVFNSFMWQYSHVFYAIGYIAILVLGLQRIEDGQMSIGMLLGLLALIFYILDPVQKIFDSIGNVQAGIAAAARINVIRTAPLEETGKIILNSVMKSIRFENVSFSYDGITEILTSINLLIPKGAKVAIVGKTGSGKTTIIQLLLKLYSNYSGVITIDNISLCNYNTDSVRRKIVFISQDVQLFKDSIRNNIDLSKSLTDSEITEIIKQVNLDGLISRLEKGIDTIVGEEGINFSGGERQRIAIARSMAVKPDVIVLDEYTSSLDPQNEDLISNNLIQHFKDKTVIYISHRQATIKHCDIIYVFKDGKIVESGNHDELMNLNNEYCLNFTK